MRSGQFSSNENANTNNSSALQMEPIKLKQIEFAKAKDYDSAGSYDPGKSGA